MKLLEVAPWHIGRSTYPSLGYEVIRQNGSHVKLRHHGVPPHTVTVPLHNPLKTGTLHGILRDVARMKSLKIESIIDLL